MRSAETVTLAGGALDRAAHLRAGSAALRTRNDARILVLHGGRVPVRADGRLAWLAADDPVASGGDAMFLGMNGWPCFAIDLTADRAHAADLTDAGDPPDLPGASFSELRPVMTGLARHDAECVATALALSNWHATHGFCARCGARSAVADAGWRRECPSCGAQHFPRTDPVVIMLIERGERVLLGRSPHWPERMYSLLAGFVEPGETVEAAVRREVLEESGVIVGAVGYLASQPWPFPGSLMLGCRGRAETEEITLDPAELEDALWLGKRDLARVFAGAHPDIAPPRQGAIAGFLLKSWLADSLR